MIRNLEIKMGPVKHLDVKEHRMLPVIPFHLLLLHLP